MNWDAVGAVGQVLGSLAVCVTLGYLAEQVRHAQDQARRALSQARPEASRDFMALYTDERISKIHVKAQEALGVPLFPTGPAGEFATSMERAGLTRDEAVVMTYLHIIQWNYRIQVIPHLNELSASERWQFEAPMRAIYGRPGVGRVFYETYIKNHHPDTVRYIDNLLAHPSSTPA